MEIRELESKLRAGYMNKERAVQLLEKEANKEKEKVCRNYKVWIFKKTLLPLALLALALDLVLA